MRFYDDFSHAFLPVFAGPFFGLPKPFLTVGDYAIIAPRRPTETAYLGLNFSVILIIILSLLSS